MPFTLPEIPKEYLVFALLLFMIVLAIIGIDSWTHAIIGSIAGYILGKDIQRLRNETL
jgi:hypothetical protein